MYTTFPELCQLQGTSIYKISKETGISPKTLYDWQKGVIPRNENLKKVADYLGIPMSELTFLNRVEAGSDAVAQNDKEAKPPEKDGGFVDPSLLAMLRTLSRVKQQRVKDFVAGMMAI